VIAAMIGAGGLGDIVLQGITQLDVGKGFIGGLCVVILAILLDRLTQSLAHRKQEEK
jgi:glycine betaine/proline transport system permease protein